MTTPTREPLVGQVREALDGPCGKHMWFDYQSVEVPRKLRDCPDCLPVRVAAMARVALERGYEDALNEAMDNTAALTAALETLRGEP